LSSASSSIDSVKVIDGGPLQARIPAVLDRERIELVGGAAFADAPSLAVAS
jgi:hypothetical protein